MPTAQLGGPSVSHPRGGRGTGLLLEFSLRGPSCDRDTALHWPALWSVGRRGGHCLPDPRASHVTWAPAPSLGKSPRVTGRLHSCLPWTLGLGWGGTGGGCCRPHCSPLSFRPQAPRLRDHRKAPAGCAALASPGPEPPFPRPGMASSAQDHRGPAWAGRAAHERGPGGQPSPPQAAQCATPAVQPHSPTSRQCHRPPRAPPRPQHAPSCQSRCRVVSRPLPRGWVSAPSPPVYSLPGRFFADF